MRKIDLRHKPDCIYNLDCHLVPLTGAKAGLMACALAPGESSEAHNHIEREAFLFTSGRASIVVPSGEVIVEAGEAVLFDRFETHTVINKSSSQQVTFHSIYWDDQNASAVPETDVKAPDNLTPLLVFSTPPTPNGDLHCGHLSGPYIAADALVRARKLVGGSAWHITGRDDHQTYVEKKAREEGISPQEAADLYSEDLQKTWSAFDIAPDNFITPDRCGPYAKFARKGLNILISKGFVESRSAPANYSTNGDYLHEAQISGNCPHCGAASDGNACESCGRPILCTGLTQARSVETSGPVVTGHCTRLFFRLSRLNSQLDKYVKSSEMSPHALALSLGMLEDGLPDIPVTHPTSWGIPVSEGNVRDQILYVWFEMAFAYLWGAAQSPHATGKDPWDRAKSVYDGQTQIVHCYGFDNSWYHTILFPAVYLALGLEPPNFHVVNELLDLNDEKFSTSRGHLIGGRDLQSALDCDMARFALLRNRPESLRSNFDVDDIAVQLQRVFGSALPDWLAVFAKQAQTLGNQIPEPGAWLGEHQRFFSRLQLHAQQLKQATNPQTASLRGVAKVFEDLVLEGTRFQRAQDHLFENSAGTQNYRRSAVALGAAAMRLFCAAAKIVSPNLGQNLVQWLNLETPFDGDIRAQFLEGGHTLSPDRPQVEPFRLVSIRDRLAHLAPSPTVAHTKAI